MSGAKIMSGAESRKWVHQKPTNQPTWGLASLHGLTAEFAKLFGHIFTSFNTFMFIKAYI